ncbi:CoA transferase, partial [Staphylococcus aureus]
QILAELGAEVTKIERPRSGDESRSFEPRLPAGESAYFFAFNRAKRSMTLNLKSPRGQEIARALAAKADVVLENFLPG